MTDGERPIFRKIYNETKTLFEKKQSALFPKYNCKHCHDTGMIHSGDLYNQSMLECPSCDIVPSCLKCGVPLTNWGGMLLVCKPCAAKAVKEGMKLQLTCWACHDSLFYALPGDVSCPKCHAKYTVRDYDESNYEQDDGHGNAALICKTCKGLGAPCCEGL